MLKKKIFVIVWSLLWIGVLPQSILAQRITSSSKTWGDRMDGTYRNPILPADYSDPDVIMVGDNFYMVCSDFHFMGIQVLTSKDLVNWKLIGQIYNRIDVDTKYNTMQRYGGGSWAPSLRYHNGTFYVYFCTPDEGLFVSTTKNPAGTWSPLKQIKAISGWEDPCPFWDEDGNAYLGRSALGAGPIIIHKMSKDGMQLLDDGVTVYNGPTSEGTKIYKRNSYYYLIIPEGGVSTGYQTALRSKNIYGPYERKVVLEQGKTNTNGPHQGGLVELPSGESWFIHFQSAGILGRICHLQPVVWKEDWPYMGIDQDGNGIGEPVEVFKKPNVGKHSPAYAITTSDEFNSKKLGSQWQWNHNPNNTLWTLNSPKGFLSLQAENAKDLMNARNTLTQKLMGKNSTATTLLLTDAMQNGQKAGLCLFGSKNQEIGVFKINDTLRLFANNNGNITTGAIVGKKVFLKSEIDLKNDQVYFLYSTDGKRFERIGKKCELSDYNYWKGARVGLFSYNTIADGGTAKFNWFHYNIDRTW